MSGSPSKGLTAEPRLSLHRDDERRAVLTVESGLVINGFGSIFFASTSLSSIGVDDQDRDFPNLGAARAHAIDCARGFMVDELTTKGEIDLSHWIEIEDEKGEMDVVPFSEAVTIKAAGKSI